MTASSFVTPADLAYASATQRRTSGDIGVPSNGPSSRSAHFRSLTRQTAMSSQDVRIGLLKAIADDECEVLIPGSKRFATSASLFNGSIRSDALAVVRPTNATHVSATVRYCRANGLDMSVKGGGSGVHGQSVGGHVILDMISMNHVSIALPNDGPTLEESFERLQLDNRRPSLPSASSSSSTVTKRSAQDAGVDEDDAKYKRRDLEDIREDEDSRRSSSTPSSSEQGHDSSRSNSGSHSGTHSREGTQSTPGTSLTDSSGALDVTRAVDAAFSYVNPAGESSRGRTTYVNPTPIAVGSFPFVPMPQGSVPSYASPYESGFGGSPLRLNTNPDPPPYALATFGAGTHSKTLDAFTANSPFGAFHVPTSAFPVGAGQFLSGGFGFIGRRHGLAMDVLVEAEVVLADGRIVWVGENGRASGEWRDDEDPSELWWGLRGAGAALGVVTRFRTKAFYIPSVFAGNFIYVYDRATAPSLLRHVRDCIKGSPRTLYANIIMTAGPPGAPAIVVIQLCFSGPRTEGEQYVQAIASWDGGRCLFQDFSERTFERQQVAVEDVLKGGHGKKWYIKSDMLKSLTDEVIEATCERFTSIPDGCTWLFEFTGGGVQSEIKDSCYPQSRREAMFTVAALHQWAHDEPPALDTLCVTTAEEWIREVIRPNSTGGPLPCFLQSARTDDVRDVYGEHFERLVRLKRTVDPTGFFKHAMFVRLDGAEGPDEWKQLPPLTEERVRERNAELASAAKGKARAVPLSDQPLGGAQLQMQVPADDGKGVEGRGAVGDGDGDGDRNGNGNVDESMQVDEMAETMAEVYNNAAAATATATVTATSEVDDAVGPSAAAATVAASVSDAEPDNGATAQSVRERQVDAPGQLIKPDEASVVSPVRAGPV